MSTSAKYRPEIDGLRFFAIAIVVLGHLTERVERFNSNTGDWPRLVEAFYRVLAQPGPGVLLFFGISGFIIASQLVKAPGSPVGSGFLYGYFKRRILRIEPPYLLLLVATFAFLSITGFVPPGAQRFSTQDQPLFQSFLASILYSHGWLFGEPPRIFGPGWSLEIEVQFYALIPFIFAAAFSARLPGRGRGIIAIVVLIAATLIATTLPSSRSAPFLHFTIVHFFPFFWVGVIFAVYQEQIRAQLASTPASLLGAAGWGGVLVIALSPQLGTWTGSSATTYVAQVLGIAGAFVGVLVADTGFKRFCSFGWISLIGTACYSIYLTHLQLMQIGAYVLHRMIPLSDPMAAWALGFFVLVPVTIVVGLAFYVIVERTFMIPDWPDKLGTAVKSVFTTSGRRSPGKDESAL